MGDPKPEEEGRPPGGGPFVELTARSAFSFLEGASLPEALARRAAEVEMPALALTDRFDLGGAVRFERECEARGVRPVHGAELLVEFGGGGSRTDTGEDAICGREPLVFLCMDRRGYGHLSDLITRARLANPRGEPGLPAAALEDRAEGLLCLWRSARDGDRRGDRGHREDHPTFPVAGLSFLRELFPGRLYLALEHHGLPEEGRRADRWIRWARETGLPWLPVNAPRYARPGDRIAHDVLTCIRHGTTLREAGDRLRPNGEWYLKSAEQMRRRWCRQASQSRSGGRGPRPRSGARDGDPSHRCSCSGCRALRRTVEVADRCDFRITDLEPRLPAFPTPGDQGSDAFLRALVREGARERYGEELTGEHREQIDHELEVIGRLEMADYFLIMWDVVRFASRRGILVQGRGSAANSAVCYCLGITAVDPVGRDLLFERFLSEERGEAPDIDLDIAHDDREEVLQYVYDRWGREHAAMVCETITYRGRMAVRDAARVLGFSPDVADRLAMEADRGEARDAARRLADGGAERAGLDPGARRTRALIRAVAGLHRLPRHRSIHVGGFVVTRRPVGEVVPVEEASMEDRTIIQWDKDDLERAGLVKLDLLGLGMLTVLGESIRRVRETRGVDLDLAALPAEDPETYDMICAADTIGVFQIESRAQMNTLPRMKPRSFYDLAIEVALIRPGPIQGDMVHPYLRRRRGEEPVGYLDPRLEPVLERTLGVPLFQEQGMKVAITLAGFTPAQADRLRRAMGFKRSERAMRRVGRELEAGLKAHDVPPEVREKIFGQLTAFANYGFPESHALSFALLVYASAYLKCHYAPEFYCALLNSQPMGFYAPSTLIHDARRHGVEVRSVDLARSAWDCTLEPPASAGAAGTPDGPPRRSDGRGRFGASSERRSSVISSLRPGRGSEAPPAARPDPARSGGEGREEGEQEEPALRIGLRMVRGLGERARERLEAARARGPFASVEDVVRRSGLGVSELRTLAEAGAFDTLWPGRREALWELLREIRGDAGPLAPRPRAGGEEPPGDPPRRSGGRDRSGASSELRSSGVSSLRPGRASEDPPPAPTDRPAASGSEGRDRSGRSDPGRFPSMTRAERVLADYRTVGLSVEGHPMEFLRERLRREGALTAAEVKEQSAGEEVEMAGVAICRQRPSTAKGVMFVTLEDETGLANFVVMHDVQERFRDALFGTTLLRLEGVVEREGAVVNVRVRRASCVETGRSPEGLPQRDFR